MRVKLLTTMAGPDGCFGPGSTADLPEGQARALVAFGYAEPVDPMPPAPETATRPDRSEKAVAPRPRKK